MTIRSEYEAHEASFLSEFAVKSAETKGRNYEEKECDVRTAFQRDRDRIIHSKAFRRLKHKTQVFISPEGDHYRTRLTHTLEVSQIARTTARALRLNEDLTEAIALGHDLGHTPFGHAGETALNEVHKPGFKHNLQSLRTVEVLEKKSPNYDGLNLTWEVRDGIVNHTMSSPQASSLEGQIVRFADRIAYINHDLDDSLRAGVIRPNDIPKHCTEILGGTSSKRIDHMVRDMIINSMGKSSINMSSDVYDAMIELRKFLFSSVYIGSIAKAEEYKAVNIVKVMYELYSDAPELLAQESGKDLGDIDVSLAACDYIAGMTDRYVTNQYVKHFVPHSWNSAY